jgi:hypothetical protein
MLDAHSQIAISPETHFYTKCRSQDGREERSLADIWSCLEQQVGVQDMDLTEQEVQRIWEQVEQISGASPADLLRILCTTYAERSEARAWGEKTPDHLGHVNTLLREFPESVVLSIVRDPRDVCLSLRGMPWNRDSLPESARKWRRYASVTTRYQKSYPSRFRAVRYEDLLDNPRQVLRKTLEWIGASFEEGVFAFYKREGESVGATQEPWKKKTRRPLDQTNKEKWRTQMGPAERWIVQMLTRPELKEWGYDAPDVPFGTAFIYDLARVLQRSVQTVAGRIVARWKTPPRAPGDYRPTWLRRKQLAEDRMD